MQTSLFDFDLPPALIALRPVEPRDSARLLVVHPEGETEHRHFRDLASYLQKDDVLSFNDSRVIRARLTGFRLPRGSLGVQVPVEVTLHKRTAPDRFLAFVKPARRLQVGDQLIFPGLAATIASRAEHESIWMNMYCANAIS